MCSMNELKQLVLTMETKCLEPLLESAGQFTFSELLSILKLWRECGLTESAQRLFEAWASIEDSEEPGWRGSSSIDIPAWLAVQAEPGE